MVDRAARRGYGLPSTFMSSKPDAGINHKEFGVTSEGVAVFLHEVRHAPEADPKPRHTPSLALHTRSVVIRATPTSAPSTTSTLTLTTTLTTNYTPCLEHPPHLPCTLILTRTLTLTRTRHDTTMPDARLPCTRR